MKKILGVLILVFITTVSCTTKYKDMQSFETVWQKASAEDVGLNPALMDRLIQDAHEGRFPNLHALIVVKDSRIVVEEYFGEFDAKTRHYTERRIDARRNRDGPGTPPGAGRRGS
jgi:hypothetical protein